MSQLQLRYLPVAENGDCVATVRLSRPDVANALSAELLQQLGDAFTEVGVRKNCRALLLYGQGKHFCAGADLQWMRDAAKLSAEANRTDTAKLARVFASFNELPIPTIAAVRGSAFGGALGLICAADVAIAAESAIFCMSEVRLGLLPAVILPYVARKMHPGQLRRNALGARRFTAAEAYSYGVVEQLCADHELAAAVSKELGLLLACGPGAQARFKALHTRLVAADFDRDRETMEAIAAARAGSEGQEGLAAFFAKRSPAWVVPAPEDLGLDA